MDFVLDLLQGVGLAAADRACALGFRCSSPARSRPPISASTSTGRISRSSSPSPFLVVLAVAFVVATLLAERRYGERGPTAVYAVVAALLGALEAAGSLADRGHSIIPGVILGAGRRRARASSPRAALFARVRRRLDAEAAGALPVYAEGIALVAAGLSILFPPLALLVVGRARVAADRGPPPRRREVRRLRVLR